MPQRIPLRWIRLSKFPSHQTAKLVQSSFNGILMHKMAAYQYSGISCKLTVGTEQVSNPIWYNCPKALPAILLLI